MVLFTEVMQFVRYILHEMTKIWKVFRKLINRLTHNLDLSTYVAFGPPGVSVGNNLFTENYEIIAVWFSSFLVNDEIECCPFKSILLGRRGAIFRFVIAWSFSVACCRNSLLGGSNFFLCRTCHNFAKSLLPARFSQNLDLVRIFLTLKKFLTTQKMK